MRILFANALMLNGTTGTEVVTGDLAKALVRRDHPGDHRIAIYSSRYGPAGVELRHAGIAVTDDLTTLDEPPDLIHGNCHRPLMEALLHFPGTPAISVCHGETLWDTPYAFPRIRKYLAVDERCRASVEHALGSAAGEVEVVANAVDTDRFRPRVELPERPRRALIFSNQAHGGTHLPVVRKACRKMGIELDVMGESMGTANRRPETVLLRYDLVFAKARCALEAMAVGNAVVLCDSAGVGPYVTAADFDAMRRKNFGVKLLTEPLVPSALLRQMARYDAADATALSVLVREKASLHAAARRWEAIYHEVVAGFDAGRVDRDEESRAAAAYLARWHYFQRYDWEQAQLEGLKRIPMAGSAVYKVARWALRRIRPLDDQRSSLPLRHEPHRSRVQLAGD